MPQIGLWLVANIFTALLPPIPDDATTDEDRDYYEILGLTRSATSEDIRKAYKVLSLKLHPDKVAQRKETNAEEAARKYELVQEAYGVLVNEEKRQRYHALQCSPRRYRFVKQGTYANPAALYENLTHARTVDKTRLVVLCTVIILILFIQPILICSKVNQVLEDDGGALESSAWVALLAPTWIIGAIWILFYVLLFVLTPKEAKVHVVGSLVETILWYIGAILFAMKLDGSFQGTFAQAMVPIYLAMVTKWISKGLMLWTIRKDVGRMVTVEYLEKQVLKGKSLEELTEEEQENLRKAYLVVTVSPDFVPEPVEESPNNVEPADLEEIYEVQKVEASQEYEAAMDIYFTTLGGLVGSMVFGLVFVILLTLKLDRTLEASYWVVFTPIWIHIGSRLIYYLYQCACGTAMGEEFILQMQHNADNAERDEGHGETDDALGRPVNNDFVDPSTSISKFNSTMSTALQDPILEPNLSVTETVNSNIAVDDKKTTESSGTQLSAKDEKDRSATPHSVPSDEADEAQIIDNKVQKNTKSAGPEEEEKTGEAEPEYIHLDEETFHAWQSAYEEAERGAMEEQAKASVECCNLSVQLMIIIMVVAKIETGYWDNDTPNDPGFNTFWILFPFFLFFGLLLCCCACLIYGAEPGNASDLTENDGQAPGEENETQQNEPVIVAAVPPPKVEDEPKAETANAPQAPVEEDVEAGGKPMEPEELLDMDELD